MHFDDQLLIWCSPMTKSRLAFSKVVVFFINKHVLKVKMQPACAKHSWSARRVSKCSHLWLPNLQGYIMLYKSP